MSFGVSETHKKLISEFIVKNFKDKIMSIGIVRFGNVFNSYGSVGETFKDRIFNLDKIKLSHPLVERFFMSLDEATNLIISSLNLITNKKKTQTSCLFVIWENQLELKSWLVKFCIYVVEILKKIFQKSTMD